MGHEHTGRCGDLHKFEGQPWADEALNNSDDEVITRDGMPTAILPNGLVVSIITDGYGSEQGLYEARVTDQVGDGVPDIIPTGDGTGTYGWLSPAKLGTLLAKAARYELRTTWVFMP